jgi:nickel transport protein
MNQGPHLRAALVLTAVLISVRAPAHGVRLAGRADPPGIEARYADGAPIAHAEVQVWAPDDPDTPWQLGATDREGRFAFIPAHPGAWRLEIDDGLGHGESIVLTVTEDGRTGFAAASGAGPGWLRWWAGIATVFGLFGAARLVRRRVPSGEAG